MPNKNTEIEFTTKAASVYAKSSLFTDAELIYWMVEQF